MQEIYIKAGKRIYLTRMARGYTRERLAELVDITPKFLYQIENGKTGFSVAVLYNICQVLKVSSDYIITGNDSIGYDKSLLEVLSLYNTQQTAVITNMLRELQKLF